MANITFLGLGAMGSRMAANLLKAGHRVTVWNRSPQAADALVAAGAICAATPREAVHAAAVVLSMVRDDEASQNVWLHPEYGALQGMAGDGIAVECSTVSRDWILQLGARALEHGIPLIDAPVSGSRPQAQAGELVFLVGGEVSAVDATRDILLTMGSSLNHVGGLGTGTLVKLATNALLGVQVTTLAELLGMLASNNVDVHKAFDAIGATSVSSLAAQRSAASMLTANFNPQFPVSLIAKDFGYVVQAAGGAVAAPTIEAAHQVFNTALAEGLGGLNMTSVARLFAPDEAKRQH